MMFLPILMLAIQQPPAEAAKWQTVELVSNDDLAVRLKVRKEAALFETGWVKLEFENKTKQPLHVTFRCSANAKLTPKGEHRAASVTLFPQFSDHDFGWKNANGSLATLAPGATAAGEELLPLAISNSLRLPPEKGQEVEAQIQMNLNFLEPRRPRLTTPRGGVAFAFTWKRPSDEQLKRARDEFIQILTTSPIERTALYNQRLHSLTGVPELHRDLPINQILAALNRFSDSGFRVDLYRALVLPRRNDPEVIAYYRERIKAGDRAALYDLLNDNFRIIPGKRQAEVIALWDKSFTDAAVSLYEQDPAKQDMAFAVLIRRSKEWSDDPKITGRLAAAVRKLYPIMDKKLEQLGQEDVQQLMRGIERLGKTRDKASLPWLKKTLALDYPTPFPPPMIHLPNYPTGSSVAHQSAMAVAEILDGDFTAMLQSIRQRQGNARATAGDVIAYANDRLERWESESKKSK